MKLYNDNEIKRLDKFFRAVTRLPQAQSLISNGLFDFEKIIEQRRKHGLPERKPSLTQIDRVASMSEQHVPEETFVPIRAPDGVEHPIFNRSFRRLAHNWYKLHNVYLSFDVRNNGAPQYYIFDENRQLVNGLFFGATPFLEEPQKVIEASSVFCDDLFPKPNICHFLFDKLPRFLTAREMYGSTCPLFFHSFRYTESILEPYGAEPAFLCTERRRAGTVFCKELVICSDSFTHLCHPGNFCDPRMVNYIRELGPTTEHGNRRVILRRSEGLPRSMTNTAEVETLAIEYGFEAHDPATMSVADQISLFRECDVLLGVHGAGLSNLAWMPSGSTVIELLPPLSATHAYWVLSHGFGHRYKAVVCNDPEFSEMSKETFGVHNNRRDVVVPLDALEQALHGL